MVADQDIRVFKICRKEVRDGSSDVYSAYMYKQYTIDELYSMSEMKVTPISSGFGVSDGFHSYSDDCKVLCSEAYYDKLLIRIYSCSRSFMLDYFLSDKNRAIVKCSCTIPKGSKYFKNEDGEIVSDNIIIDDYTFF